MKLAVVIDVGHGSETLKRAVDTQMLLLERLGTRLDSIRLAAPRLLDIAYASALAERPDVLVMVGSARSARRAGQLGYEQKIPVIFLPGVDAPEWARSLWGTLSLEEMVTALARGNIKRVRLGAGLVANQIFFDDARCGLLPFLPELRRDISESDTFSEGWQALLRAADVSSRLLRRGLRFSFHGGTNRATALVLRPAEGHVQAGSMPESRLPVFRGTAFHFGPVSYLASLMRGSVGGQWQGGRQEDFTCRELSLQAQPGAWILLDGDPLRLPCSVDFRFVPGAVESCIFAPARQIANDNAKMRQRLPYGDAGEAAQLAWNFPSPSDVAIRESRESGEARHRRQV